MTYNKPELVTSNPIKAIQGVLGKPINTHLDAVTDPNDPNFGQYNATTNAYEADE